MTKSVLEGRLSLREAAAECRLSRQSAAKWVRRYRLQGMPGLRDRSSRPFHRPRCKPDELVVRVEALRRQRWTGVRIARELQIVQATVSHILRRLGLNRIRDIEPQLRVGTREPQPGPGVGCAADCQCGTDRRVRLCVSEE